MTPVLRNIEYVGAYTLRLFFADGPTGADLSPAFLYDNAA